MAAESDVDFTAENISLLSTIGKRRQPLLDMISKMPGVHNTKKLTCEKLREFIKAFALANPGVYLGSQQIDETQSTGTIKYADFFCGLGAFHMANREEKEFECVLACDVNADVRNIYEANYNIKPHGDIRKLDMVSMPDFDILCAGFPCQPFSIAGNGAGFNDDKGNLFYELLKIIDVKAPKMCVLENVKNLKTHDNGNTYKTIERELLARQYFVSSKIINAADCGSPQARHRIFIVATKGKPFAFPVIVPVRATVADIIDFEYTRQIDLEKYKLVKKTGKVSNGKPTVLFDIVSKKTNKGGRQGERVYSINSPGITICASSGGPGAKTGLYMVGDIVRRLTVGESLKMFGFPADYKFPGVSQETALFCLGNSIVVNVLSSLVPSIRTWFMR